MINFLHRHPAASLAIKIIISISLLSFLMTYLDYREVADSMAKADIRWIAAGFISLLLNIVIQFLRWKFLLRLISEDISDSTIWQSLMIGFSAGFFTPAQVGEFGGRIAPLRAYRASHVVGMGLLDRFYLLAVIIITSCVTLPLFVLLYVPGYWNNFFFIPAFLTGGSLVVLFLSPQIGKKALSFLPDKIRRHRFYGIVEVIENEFHAPQAKVFFGWTVLFMLIVDIQYYILLNAFTQSNFIDSLICVPNILLVKSIIIPVSIGDLGIRESAAVFFYSRCGVPPAAALNASLGIFILNILIPSIIGAISIARMKIQK